MVAEKQAQFTMVAGKPPGPIEPFPLVSQPSGQAFPQNLFIGGNPGQAAFGDDRQGLVAD